MRISVPEEILPAADLGRVHCVGIGGAGISAIARILAARGLPVTGSDDHDTPFLPSLREVGVTCHLGYDPTHLGDLGPGDTAVVTTAAREDNPEVLEARKEQELPEVMLGCCEVLMYQKSLCVDFPPSAA